MASLRGGGAHRAMALHDIEHGVLADAEPVADFPVRLSVIDQFQNARRILIRLDSLARPTPEDDTTRLGCGDTGAHAFAQQIALELGQGGHQRGDQFALGRTEVELQSGLSNHRDAPRLQIVQRVKEIQRRVAPAGQFGDENCVDVACLGEREYFLARHPVVLCSGSRFLPHTDYPVARFVGKREQVGLLLCYLRFPGRTLRQGEAPPVTMLAFVAEQLALDPARFADYAERDQTRRAHLAEIQTAFGYRPFTRGRYRELAASLLPTALATEKGAAFVALALDALRTQRIMVPPLPTIERLCGEVRARAHRQLWRTLTTGLTDAQFTALDRLLTVRAGGGQSTLAWLRQTAYAATADNFPKLIERLRPVRALGIEPERATRIHQNHWLKLAREGGRSTVQHLAELEPLHRYATLTALVLELTATLTDEALNRFEHLIASLFKKTARARR